MGAPWGGVNHEGSSAGRGRSAAGWDKTRRPGQGVGISWPPTDVRSPPRNQPAVLTSHRPRGQRLSDEVAAQRGSLDAAARRRRRQRAGRPRPATASASSEQESTTPRRNLSLSGPKDRITVFQACPDRASRRLSSTRSEWKLSASSMPLSLVDPRRSCSTATATSHSKVTVVRMRRP